MERFGARYGAAVRLVTIVVGGALVAGVAAGLARGDPLLGALCLLVLLACALFAVRGYALEGKRLFIRRLLWSTRLDLSNLAAARAERGAIADAIRLWGTGGVFGMAGWHHSEALGTYRSDATNESDTVVLTFREGAKVVVSPDDPDRFVEVLERLLPGMRPA